MPAVLYEKKDKIAFITLNRPEVMNALNLAIREGLSDAFIQFKDDPDVWTAIVTGTGGKAFSAGADLAEMSQRHDAAHQTARYVTPPPPHNMVTPTRGFELWKPVIAAINGYCLAGGLELALACDIRICSEDSKFGLAEVKRAILPGGGGTQRLPRFIPFGVALEILFTGDFIDAQTAYRYGLVNHVVPKDKVMDEAIALANKINDNGPLAVRMIKELAYRGVNMPLDHGLALEKQFFSLVTSTEDAREGPKAFVEKRKPVYKGR